MFIMRSLVGLRDQTMLERGSSSSFRSLGMPDVDVCCGSARVSRHSIFYRICTKFPACINYKVQLGFAACPFRLRPISTFAGRYARGRASLSPGLPMAYCFLGSHLHADLQGRTSSIAIHHHVALPCVHHGLVVKHLHCTPTTTPAPPRCPEHCCRWVLVLVLQFFFHSISSRSTKNTTSVLMADGTSKHRYPQLK